MEQSPAILEVANISKEYPGVQALKDVSLTLPPGEVVALMGENGAGKSTLIRIMGGLEKATTGQLTVGGRDVEFRNASESQSAGISVVSQEFRLVPQLTVAENIYLGRELTSRGLIRTREARSKASALMTQLGLAIDPRRAVETLSVGDQQMVEIARALANDFDVLIMDEPSAALNRSEIKRLLALVRRLREQGKAILYVSHHLEEIFEIADRICVFRDGRSVADLQTQETTEAELVSHMLGRELQTFEAERADSNADVTAGAQRLVVSGFRCSKILTPVSFSAHRGEILGVAGLVGSGRNEMMEGLFGVLPVRGSVRVDDKEVRLSSPASAVNAGIFMLSEDRKAEGILPHLSVLENLLIAPNDSDQSALQKRFPQKPVERTIFERLKEELRIRVNKPDQYIGNLSGGNQQKVLFGRAILSGCVVLLLNEPTRGVDVGAKVEIYQLIQRVAAQGVVVVISSSDTAELVALADRCMIFRSGSIEVELRGDEVTEDNILGASVGTATSSTPTL